MVVSLLMNGGFIGFLVWAGAHVAEEVLEEEPVEVTFFDAAPPPPPPPPPPAGGSKPKTEKKKKTPDVEPDPVEVEPIPEELPEEEPEEPEVESEVEGVEGGVVGGVGGGVIGGVLGGQLGGTKAYHWSEVKPKRRVKPKFPAAAKALNLTEERCQVRFFIDEKGKPYDIKIEKCPTVFHDAVKTAAWNWRFYPMKENGKAVRAQFVLGITFKLR